MSFHVGRPGHRKNSPLVLEATARVASALGAVGGGILTLAGLLTVLASGNKLLGVLIFGTGVVLVVVAAIGWSLRRSALREIRRREEQAARHGLFFFPDTLAHITAGDAGADRLDRVVPYVRRSAHAGLEDDLKRVRDAALAHHGLRMVVLEGASKAGKSRLLYEAAREIFADWTVVRPRPESLAAMLTAEGLPVRASLEHVVLWLDDLETYCSPGIGGLNRATLGSYLYQFAGRADTAVAILATLGGRGAEMTAARGETDRVSSVLGEISAEFVRVELSEHLDDEELTATTRALNLGATPALDEVRNYGLGAHLVGGPALVNVLRTGRTTAGSPTNRAGQHLAWLIAWWAGLGIVRPMPASTLEDLWKRFPPPEVGGATSTLASCVAWATTAIVASRPAIALVTQPTDDGYAVYDYVAANLPEPPPSFDAQGVTEAILALVGGLDLLMIATAAYARDDDALAERAWIKVLRENDQSTGPPAAFGLGLLLKRKGRTEGAKQMFEHVVASEHPDAAPRALNSIAQLLNDEGNTDGALQIFETLRSSPHPLLSSWGAFEAGLAHQKLGHSREAEDAYIEAVESQHPDASPRSAVNVAILRYQRGDNDGSREMLERAIATGHHEQAPKAFVNLAVLRRSEGNLDGAREALETAASSGDPQATVRSLILLARLHLELGDHQRAIDLLREAVAFESGTEDTEAWWYLGTLVEDDGQPSAAAEAYEKVLAANESDFEASAAFRLGALRQAAGETEAAISAYRRGMDAAEPEYSPLCAWHFGRLVADDDPAAALPAFQAAAASGQDDLRPISLLALAVVQTNLRDREGARETLRDLREEGGTSELLERARVVEAKLDEFKNEDGDDQAPGAST